MKSATRFTNLFTVLAAFLAALFSAFLEFYLIRSFSEFIAKVSMSAALGTFLALLICARGLVKTGTTPEIARRKGVWAGLLSIYFTSACLAIWGMTDNAGAFYPYMIIPSLFWAVIIFPFVMIFGGYLAPVLIGWTAFSWAKKI